MPWNVTKGDDRCPASKPYAVVGGRSGNALFGCHPDKDSARNQQKALYAAEGASSAAAVAYTTPPTQAW